MSGAHKSTLCGSLPVPNMCVYSWTSMGWCPRGTTGKLINCPYSKFHGPTWGPSGADRTQVGPKLVPWPSLSGWVTVSVVTKLKPDAVQILCDLAALVLACDMSDIFTHRMPPLRPFCLWAVPSLCWPSIAACFYNRNRPSKKKNTLVVKVCMFSI